MESDFKPNTDEISIVHLDKLHVTLKHHQHSAFRNERNPDSINVIQQYGDIALHLNNQNGSKSYYNGFDVYCEGKKIGTLLSAEKFNKTYVEFDFDKRILYSNKSDWWYDLFLKLEKNLGLTYNNINKLEIAWDSTINNWDRFGGLYRDSDRFLFSDNSYYQQSKKSATSILHDFNQFLIEGKDNSISIYQKNLYAEDYIMDFFKSNMMSNCDIYRVECRLSWNYIRKFINKKNQIINLDTLRDTGMLTELFVESVKTKLTFKDLRTKYHDKNNNEKFVEVSVLDNVELNTVSIPTYLPLAESKHYKAGNAIESTFGQLYYHYIDSGQEGYIQSLEGLIRANLFSIQHIEKLLTKFSKAYHGDRTLLICNRMTFIHNRLSLAEMIDVDELIHLHISRKMDELELSKTPALINFFQ